MGKIAFLFSGQGAQYVGMGKEFYDHFEKSRQVFERASESLGMDLKKLCFDGPIERLNQTEYTQPTVVTVSIVAYEVLIELGIKPEVAAGFSLGEYSALTASGALTIETVIPLVHKRGRYMQEAVPEGKGKMLAILGLTNEQVEEVCKAGKPYGVVAGANYNCPGQVVIGGETKAVEEAEKKAQELGARKIVTLALSAPFHTSLLEPAAIRLKKDLEQISFGHFQFPLISNVTADIIKEDEIKELLKRQVMSPVLWEATIRKMLADGVDTFIELGPGKTLSSLVRRIDRSKITCNVENMETLKKTLVKLK